VLFLAARFHRHKKQKIFLYCPFLLLDCGPSISPRQPELMHTIAQPSFSTASNSDHAAGVRPVRREARQPTASPVMELFDFEIVETTAAGARSAARGRKSVVDSQRYFISA